MPGYMLPCRYCDQLVPPDAESLSTMREMESCG